MRCTWGKVSRIAREVPSVEPSSTTTTAKSLHVCLANESRQARVSSFRLCTGITIQVSDEVFIFVVRGGSRKQEGSIKGYLPALSNRGSEPGPVSYHLEGFQVVLSDTAVGRVHDARSGAKAFAHRVVGAAVFGINLGHARQVNALDGR